MTRLELERVLRWTNEKLATGEEPPWSWYRYMQLREALEAILAGMAATQPIAAGSQGMARTQGTGLRLVDATDYPDSTPRRPKDFPVVLPM
jgi:hypothetical protein